MGRAGVGLAGGDHRQKDATGRIYYMAGGDPNAPADPAPGKRSSAPWPPAEQPELIDETPAPTPKRATPTQPVSGKVDLKPVVRSPRRQSSPRRRRQPPKKRPAALNRQRRRPANGARRW